MRIPYAIRTVDIDLPFVAGQARVTVKSVMDDFRRQMHANFGTLLEAFVLFFPRRVRVTWRSALAMEEFCHSGLTFLESPITLRPCKSAKWVNITRLSYGISAEVVDDALKPFGKVLQVKIDTYHNVYVGTCNVLMEITNAIPSRLLIAGHWCNVFYVGQTPTCFTCHKSGHSSRDCPNNRVNNPPVVAPNNADPGTVNTIVLQVNPSKNTAHASTTTSHASKTLSVVAPAGDPSAQGVNSKAYAEAVKEPLHPSHNECRASSDDDDEDEFIDVAEFPMPVDPVSHKRDRSDSDSSDNSAGHLDKRGKALIVDVVQRSRCPTPAPLDEVEPPLPPIPSIPHSPSAPPVTDDYDGDNDSDDDESLATEKNLDNPKTPVNVDEPQKLPPIPPQLTSCC